jgi:hypothetical protein
MRGPLSGSVIMRRRTPAPRIAASATRWTQSAVPPATKAAATTIAPVSTRSQVSEGCGRSITFSAMTTPASPRMWAASAPVP